jgi:hypothetical protein
MKKHFEDLEDGAVFWGDECEVDKEEMLQYALKNDPLPFRGYINSLMRACAMSDATPSGRCASGPPSPRTGSS